MIHSPLQLADLVCSSIIDKLRLTSPAHVIDLSVSDHPVRIVRAPNILYVPSLGLQLSEERIVPKEAILDEWTLPYRQRTFFLHEGQEVATPFEVREVNESVCILSNFYSANFTHCIEEFFKVIVLERWGYDGRYIFSSMPPFAKEFFELLNIPLRRVDTTIDRPTVFRHCYYTTASDFMTVATMPGAFLELRDALLSATGDVPSPLGRRLWVDRGANAAGDRGVVNPEQIHPILDRYGFDRVDMASYPLRTQLAIAQNAAMIAGPHGSAFAHCMFMRPRSAVVECFSPLFLNGCSFDSCRVLNHLYMMIADWHSDYEPYAFGRRVNIKPAQLELALQHTITL